MNCALGILNMLPVLLPAVFLLLSVFPGDSSAYDRVSGRMDVSRSEVISKNGMVCAAQPLAAQIGVETVSYTHLTLPTTPYV